MAMPCIHDNIEGGEKNKNWELNLASISSIIVEHGISNN
jgi:hypothetical protein